MLSLILAVASRLHTGVRLADEADLPTRVLVPDPEAKIDLYLYSSYWLEPDVALSLVRKHAPHAFQQALPTPMRRSSLRPRSTIRSSTPRHR